MSALISLWVAMTQFLKATFAPKSPFHFPKIFFAFNGTRMDTLDGYTIADEKVSAPRFTVSSGDKMPMSETYVDRTHLSSLSR